jgi:uncharacterized protein DUF3226
VPPLPESPYRLLVEGSDDLHTVKHLMARHRFEWDNESTVRPFVSEEGGIDGLLRAIPVALKGSYERIGFVLDANSDAAARWTQVRDRARRAGLDLPSSPEPGGTIVRGRRAESRIGIWLMPDNRSSGSVEDFLSKLVPPDHPIWRYAHEATAEARQRGALCQEKDHVKSVLHTWLAWQEEPGLRFGTALKAGVFETESKDALQFVTWFHRLFVEP